MYAVIAINGWNRNGEVDVYWVSGPFENFSHASSFASNSKCTKVEIVHWEDRRKYDPKEETGVDADKVGGFKNDKN